MSQCTKIPTGRLQFFPIMMFAIVMGFSGLTLVYQKATTFLGIFDISSTLIAIDTLLLVVISSLYLYKITKYRDEVKKELTHPVRINFFAASAISFLLISAIYHDICHEASIIFFTIGTVLQTFFTLYTITYWFNNNLEITHSNPAWFIPIVGNVVVPVAGVGLVSNHLLMYYFSIGLFFWIVLTAILINRIIFHNQLAVKFMPTLFIFIAPPSVAFISYIKMYGNYDFFASLLFNLAIFFTLLLLFMYKNFMKLKFFISWWAFTFPLAAITIASMLAYDKTSIALYSYISYALIAITTSVVGLVSFKTIKHILKKEICIQE
jgi:tellurite resistance protein